MPITSSKFYFLTLLLTLSFIVAACTPKQQQQAVDTLTGEEDAMMDDRMEEADAMMPAEGGSQSEADAPLEHASGGEDDKMMEDSAPVTFSGTVLAGSSSPLLEFNQADYDKAIASDKLVLLYFYANWCPICRAEFPKMQQAFDQLSGSEVVGFRVNYNDTKITDQEKALAQKFGVAYQHTKVALRNGERILKAPDSWETQRYLDEISKLVN
jgi:thiol-disulfide isomerase/thioredoxin